MSSEAREHTSSGTLHNFMITSLVLCAACAPSEWSGRTCRKRHPQSGIE